MKNRNYKRKKCFIAFVVITMFITLHTVSGQSKVFLNPGLFYNGNGFSDDTEGLGLVLGLEYIQSENSIFSVELRTKYGYYNFDDGTKWRTDDDGGYVPPKNSGEARLTYNLFSPQIGIVPKLYLRFEDVFSLYLENELAVGLIKGEFKFKGIDKKSNFTEPVFCYNIGVGGEYRFQKYILTGSISYSTLNFRSKIRKHQPLGFKESIPNQNAAVL